MKKIQICKLIFHEIKTPSSFCRTYTFKRLIQKSFGAMSKKIYGAWYRWQCLEQVLYWISNLYLFKIVPNSNGQNTWNLFIYFIFVKFTTNFLDFWRKRRFLEFIWFDTLRKTLFLDGKAPWLAAIHNQFPRENKKMDFFINFQFKSYFVLQSRFWPHFTLLTKSHHVMIVTLI